jgi:hypothetical protein
MEAMTVGDRMTLGACDALDSLPLRGALPRRMPRSRFRRLCTARDRQPSVGARAGGARRWIPGSRARTRPRLFARGIARVVEPLSCCDPRSPRLIVGARTSDSRLRGGDGKRRCAASLIRRCDLAGIFAYRLGSCGTAICAWPRDRVAPPHLCSPRRAACSSSRECAAALCLRGGGGSACRLRESAVCASLPPPRSWKGVRA